MKTKFSKGEFIPKNPEKYRGHYPIIYKSSWELAFMNFLDKNEYILHWAYENFKIEYWNPIKRAKSIYIPDFFIEYIHKDGGKKAAIVEIKPKALTNLKNKNNKYYNVESIKNRNKFLFAEAWCKKHNIEYIILTEDNLFRK